MCIRDSVRVGRGGRRGCRTRSCTRPLFGGLFLLGWVCLWVLGPLVLGVCPCRWSLSSVVLGVSCTSASGMEGACLQVRGSLVLGVCCCRSGICRWLWLPPTKSNQETGLWGPAGQVAVPRPGPRSQKFGRRACKPEVAHIQRDFALRACAAGKLPHESRGGQGRPIPYPAVLWPHLAVTPQA